MREFEYGPIDGLIVTEIKKYGDQRGWLAELWRTDDPIRVDRLGNSHSKTIPAMLYASMSWIGARRGPHEHVEQTDTFCFFGPGIFKIVCWDNRPNSLTFNRRWEMEAGLDDPTIVVVPPGVVHAYKCIAGPGLVLNLPDRLFAGEGKKSKVDEIRHEDNPQTPFVM